MASKCFWLIWNGRKGPWNDWQLFWNCQKRWENALKWLANVFKWLEMLCEFVFFLKFRRKKKFKFQIFSVIVMNRIFRCSSACLGMRPSNSWTAATESRTRSCRTTGSTRTSSRTVPNRIPRRSRRAWPIRTILPSSSATCVRKVSRCRDSWTGIWSATRMSSDTCAPSAAKDSMIPSTWKDTPAPIQVIGTNHHICLRYSVKFLQILLKSSRYSSKFNQIYSNFVKFH